MTTDSSDVYIMTLGRMRASVVVVVMGALLSGLVARDLWAAQGFVQAQTGSGSDTGRSDYFEPSLAGPIRAASVSGPAVALAEVNLGLARATATIHPISLSPGQTAYSQVDVGYWEDFAFSAAIPSGARGRMTIYVSAQMASTPGLSGDVDASTQIILYGQFFNRTDGANYGAISLFANRSSIRGESGPLNVPYNGEFTFDFGIEPGVGRTLLLQLTTTAGLRTSSTFGGSDLSLTCESHAVVYAGPLELFGPDGTRLPNGMFTSASGLAYAGYVPEPASAAWIAVAAFALTRRLRVSG